MANELAGLGGSLRIGTVIVASLNNWKLSLNMALNETTSFGNDWETISEGVKSWNCVGSGYYIITDVSGQTSLQTAFLAGTNITLRLYVNSINYYSGNAKIASMDVDADTKDIIKVSFSFTGNGALAYT